VDPGSNHPRRAARGLRYLGLGVLVLVATAAVVEVVAIVRRRPPLPGAGSPRSCFVTLVFRPVRHATKLSYDGPTSTTWGLCGSRSGASPRRFAPPGGSSGSSSTSSESGDGDLAPAVSRLGPSSWWERSPSRRPISRTSGRAPVRAARAPRPLSPDWELARGEMRHLALYPPRCGDASWVCCQGFTPPPRPEDMYLAATAERLGLTYNGFGAARVARTAAAAGVSRLDEAVRAGRLDPGTILPRRQGYEACFATGTRPPPAGGSTASSPASRPKRRDRSGPVSRHLDSSTTALQSPHGQT